MSFLQTVSFDDIVERGSIKDEDVLRLRRAFFEDGEINRAEADELFRLNDKCPVHDAGWADFFVEAITDYTVNQERPEGYLTVENADWLIERISADGHVKTKTELELLINIIDRARWSPARLVKFAIEQVKFAALSGEGPIRSGKSLKPGVITEAEVELLRRILYAFGGDECIAISRAEAEVLFDINDATIEAENDPAWSDLFSKAIANSIMAASGYKVPSREKALARQEWLEKPADLSISGTLGRAFGGISDILSGYDAQTAEQRAIGRLEQQKIEIITNECVTEGEAEWLAERIGRDGVLHENEKALLAFIKKESPSIHPALQDLIDRACAAA